MKIRMTRFVGSFVHVQDLEPGQVYDINDGVAEQFLANGMAELIDEASTDLEAAALRAPRRRGPS